MNTCLWKIRLLTNISHKKVVAGRLYGLYFVYCYKTNSTNPGSKLSKYIYVNRNNIILIEKSCQNSSVEHAFTLLQIGLFYLYILSSLKKKKERNN